MIFIVASYAILRGKKIGALSTKPEFSDVTNALRKAAWEIPLPLIVLVGIYSGFFTVTEAASVTVVYVIVIESLIYKDLSITKDIPVLKRDSIILVGSILIILGTAMGITSYLIDEQIPLTLLETMRQYIDDPLTFLIVLN